MTNEHHHHVPGPLTPDQFVHLGQGAIAYVRPMKSEEAQALFPQIQGLQPGMQLFALVGADGEPIVLADSKAAAVANAWEHQLATVSLH
ncbi:DUF1150 domain-containing protein [Rhodoblastus acidophilus]|uniref:DUF1150 domain-containing protein n=1 Tax=Candidatus Rhodoblastus alkanivorans TaxID=2954117 RepID=A0ABS9ZBE4_9HYPH|nr:DUF1150 domain-containing protein [Candidatus Rhodoblastus alkanivorans]MCI4679375.1 DUF1150 domain-containing protein [Candidatus Rhodoblastus alkanivorans]MCI4684851.1 DUF1150 domain-containing protein [Candidatus Rhodoblastus alkanivorans]MDI4642175.1 DUF1150 domain-containing protein [Rhodoblastus acidophilus]